MRIVVTGASGFVGTHLIHVLERQEIEVVGVARRGVVGALGRQVRDYGATPAGDVLVHLAEQRDRGAAQTSGSAYRATTLGLLERLIGKGFDHVVYASSAAVYGDASKAPRHPAERLVARDEYTAVKLDGEARVLLAGGTVARLGNLYGPGMADNNVVSTILAQTPGSGPIRLWDERPVRDFCWIEDAADALARMALAQHCGVYNVGTGIGTSAGALARTALELMGEAGRPVQATRPSGRDSVNVLDIADTIATFGWRPRTTLRQGLRRLLENAPRGTT